MCATTGYGSKRLDNRTRASTGVKLKTSCKQFPQKAKYRSVSTDRALAILIFLDFRSVNSRTIHSQTSIVFTKLPEDIYRIFTKFREDIYRIFTKFREHIYRIFTKFREDIYRIFTKLGPYVRCRSRVTVAPDVDHFAVREIDGSRDRNCDLLHVHNSGAVVYIVGHYTTAPLFPNTYTGTHSLR